MTFKKSNKYKCTCKICKSNTHRFLDELCLLCGYPFGNHNGADNTCPNTIHKGHYYGEDDFY